MIVHMLRNAPSTIKKKKKNLLKFLLGDIGFTGTQIPTAVQCQIKRKTGGRQQKRCVIENLT